MKWGSHPCTDRMNIQTEHYTITTEVFETQKQLIYACPWGGSGLATPLHAHLLSSNNKIMQHNYNLDSEKHTSLQGTIREGLQQFFNRGLRSTLRSSDFQISETNLPLQ
jgi:hypothetical protein